MPSSSQHRSKYSASHPDSEHALYLPDNQHSASSQAATSYQPNDTASHSATLGKHIELVVREYFDNLKEQQPTQLYDLMLLQFEKPLISVVLEYTRGNQTKTAEILGLNRGTLRKKLKIHQLL